MLGRRLRSTFNATAVQRHKPRQDEILGMGEYKAFVSQVTSKRPSQVERKASQLARDRLLKSSLKLRAPPKIGELISAEECLRLVIKAYKQKKCEKPGKILADFEAGGGVPTPKMLSYAIRALYRGKQYKDAVTLLNDVITARKWTVAELGKPVFVCAVDACRIMKDWESVVYWIKLGGEMEFMASDSTIASAAIHANSKLGRYAAVLEVHSSLSKAVVKKQVVIGTKALQKYNDDPNTTKLPFAIDEKAYSAFVLACKEMKRFESLPSTQGIEDRVIHSLQKGQVQEAANLAMTMIEKGEEDWNLKRRAAIEVIGACASEENWSTGVELVKHMVNSARSRKHPNLSVFAAGVQTCNAVSQWTTSLSLGQLSREQGLPWTRSFVELLVKAHVKSKTSRGLWEMLNELYDQSGHIPDFTVCNTAIVAFGRQFPAEATDIIVRVRESGKKVSMQSFTAALKGAFEKNQDHLTDKLFTEMRRVNIPENKWPVNDLICSLVRLEKLEQADELFHNPEKRIEMRTCKELALAWINRGEVDKVLAVWKRASSIQTSDTIWLAVAFLRAGLTLDNGTIPSSIRAPLTRALVKSGEIEQARSVGDKTTIMNAFVEFRRWDQVLIEASSWEGDIDVSLWKHCMEALYAHNRFEEALEMSEIMEKRSTPCSLEVKHKLVRGLASIDANKARSGLEGIRSSGLKSFRDTEEEVCKALVREGKFEDVLSRIQKTWKTGTYSSILQCITEEERLFNVAKDWIHRGIGKTGAFEVIIFNDNLDLRSRLDIVEGLHKSGKKGRVIADRIWNSMSRRCWASPGFHSDARKCMQHILDAEGEVSINCFRDALIHLAHSNPSEMMDLVGTMLSNREFPSGITPGTALHSISNGNLTLERVAKEWIASDNTTDYSHNN